MAKFKRKHKTDQQYWDKLLSYHRASKTIRRLRDKIPLEKLIESTGYSKNYICGVQEYYVYPNKTFIEKLNEVLNG